VESCKGLRRISIAARLTYDGLKSDGKHANNVEVLSPAFTEDNDIYRPVLHAQRPQELEEDADHVLQHLVVQHCW
jgi:hypothetical protein